jgi:hypothetical protein
MYWGEVNAQYSGRRRGEKHANVLVPIEMPFCTVEIAKTRLHNKSFFACPHCPDLLPPLPPELYRR